MKNRFLGVYESVAAYRPPARRKPKGPRGGPGAAPATNGSAPRPVVAEVRQASLSKGQSFDYTVPGVVPVIAQPTNMTCWATVYTILESWRRQQSISIETALGEISDRWLQKFVKNEGLGSKEKVDFIRDTGLIDYDPFNPSIEGWKGMLEQFGPIWVTTNELPNTNWAIHARVIVGIKGDGTAKGTKFTIIDPAGGRKYEESIERFWPKFEDEIRRTGHGRVQILHWPDTATSQSIQMMSLARGMDAHSLRSVIYGLSQLVQGGATALSWSEAASLQLANSVGKGGANKAADVRTVQTQLNQLGFNWVLINGKADQETVRTIKLFQSIINGRQSVRGDGRVDVGGTTHQWLQAANAPRWQQMPKAGKGFIDNDRKEDNKGDKYVFMNWGTDWLIETIRDAGAYFEDNFRKGNDKIGLIATNDLSLERGGDTQDHGGHETGLMVDLRVPRNDKKYGGINITKSFHRKLYDQAAARAIIKAFRAQPLVEQVFFNDQVLIKEGLCKYLDGHNDHIHIKIKPPALKKAAPPPMPVQPPDLSNGHDTQPTAQTATWATNRASIISTAKAEEKAWSNTDGSKKEETESGVRSLLEKYWGVIHSSTTRVKQAIDDREYWSAAFICWVMNQAGVTLSHGFRKFGRHVVYITEALKNVGDATKKFHLEKTSVAQPEAGDIVCISNASWVNWSKLEQYAKQSDENKITGPTHCDIVVDRVKIGSKNFVVTIGGNVASYDKPNSGVTVGKKYFELDASGHLTGNYRLYQHDASGNRTADPHRSKSVSLLGVIKVAK